MGGDRSLVPVRRLTTRTSHFRSTSTPTWLGLGGDLSFFDYLYLGFTNATAFSPTDVMPLSRWAKLAMAVQATACLVVMGLVIARAVNILK